MQNVADGNKVHVGKMIKAWPADDARNNAVIIKEHQGQKGEDGRSRVTQLGNNI
jgi:hypothetical protein